MNLSVQELWELQREKWLLSESYQFLGLGLSPAQTSFSGAQRLWQIWLPVTNYIPAAISTSGPASLRCPPPPPQSYWNPGALSRLLGLARPCCHLSFAHQDGVGSLLSKSTAPLLSTCSSPNFKAKGLCDCSPGHRQEGACMLHKVPGSLSLIHYFPVSSTTFIISLTWKYL